MVQVRPVDVLTAAQVSCHLIFSLVSHATILTWLYPGLKLSSPLNFTLASHASIPKVTSEPSELVIFSGIPVGKKAAD